VLRWDPGTDTTAVIGSITGTYPSSFAGDADHVYWTLFSQGPEPLSSIITTITSEPSAGGAQATVASLPVPRDRGRRRRGPLPGGAT
jgi:hypothetical protein